MTQPLQSVLQAEIRKLTGKTTQDFNGDLHDLCSYYGIPMAPISGRAIGLAKIFRSDISTASAALNYLQANATQVVGPGGLFANGEPGAWYDPSDSSTLFSDTAGTTPVAQPGAGAQVNVGLMLDKSASAAAGFYSAFLAATTARLELGGQSAFAFGTGDFTVELWVYGAPANGSMLWDFRPVGGLANTPTLYYVSNQLRYFVGGDVIVGGALTAGAWNHVAVSRNGTSTKLFINGVQSGSTYTDTKNYVVGASRPAIGFNGASPGSVVNTYMSNFRVIKGAAVYTSNFTVPTSPLTAISGTSLLTLQNNYFKDNSSNAFAVTPSGDVATNLFNPFNAAAARTINNAISYNSTTARPELSARVNLLTYSEQFDNAAWTKDGATAVNTTATTDPLGGTTADILTATTTTAYTYQAVTVSTVAVTFSCYVKAATASVFWLYYFSGAIEGLAYFQTDLTTQAVAGSSQTPSNLTITSIGNGWFRISAQWSAAAGSKNFGVGISDAKGSIAVTNGRTGYVWGADLRPANIGSAIPYQRIADQYTYDNSASFPRYLRFDGVDDGMSTPANLNLTSTDKATVFAGVRKLSDAAFGVIAETSPVVDSNNGAMAIGASIGATQRWVSALRGTSLAYYEPATYAAPITNVLATSFNIAGATISDEIVPRVNGVVEQDNPVGASAGTGNFGTYPLYIGARNNASLRFNGQLYSLIVRGAATDASTISATETWVAGKTGVQL